MSVNFNFLKILLLKNLSSLITFIYGVLIARSLGAEFRGVYAYITTITFILINLAHGSLEQSHIYLYKNGNSLNELLQGAFQFSLISGGSIGLAGIAIMSWKSTSYDSNSLAWNIAFISIPAGIFSIFASSLLNISGRVQFTNKISLVLNLGQLLIISLMAALHQVTVTHVVLVWCLSLWTLALFTFFTEFSLVNLINYQSMYKQLRIGIKYHLGMISIFLLFRVDLLILARYVGAAEIGKYAVAVAIAETLFLVSDSLVLNSLKSLVEAKDKAASSITYNLLRKNTAMLALATIALGVSAKFLVTFFFGKSYDGASGILIALLPGVLAYGIAKSVFIRINIENKPSRVSAIACLTLILNVLINFALIPSFGCIGAGVATSVSYIFISTTYLVWFKRVNLDEKNRFII